MAHSKQSDNHRLKSTICTRKSKSSSVEVRKRQLILEAEKEKAKIRLELIEKTLEADLAALDDVTSSVHNQKSHHSVDVEKWIDHNCQVSKELPSVQDITAAHDAPMSYAMVQQPIPNPSTGTDIEKLATALTQAIQTSTSTMQNEQNQQLLSRIATSKDMPLYLELNKIKELRIPRCYLQPKDNNDSSKVELHVFCDASPSAYAAVAYWRIIQYGADQPTNVFVSFIASKSRVAPVKTVSIPRFELQGALLASRLATVIQDEKFKSLLTH
jgi:hypothetical protein